MVLICTSCGDEYSSEGPPTLCPCGQPLEVRLEWEDDIPFRESIFYTLRSLWRYYFVLPPVSDEHIVTLREGWTPLFQSGDYRGVSLFFKDETVNPTGSFKDRGMAMAISHLRQWGVKRVCLPSAGNAGVSAAAYCEKAGISCHVYLPKTIPIAFVRETERYGATVNLAGETISEASAVMQQEKVKEWFDLSTLKEPFRVEGKKTLGYEIAEQLGWSFPDVVIYPTGGGTGLIGMWKAFNEMRRLEWVDEPLPRMVAVQSTGCAPIVKAFAEGAARSRPWERSHTTALGLNVPNPLGGAWILKVLRESHGMAVMVEESKIQSAQKEVANVSRTDPSPEVAIAWLGFQTLVDTGWIKPGETVVIPVTGSAHRYR